jgi:hypothetical protein
LTDFSRQLLPEPSSLAIGLLGLGPPPVEDRLPTVFLK